MVLCNFVRLLRISKHKVRRLFLVNSLREIARVFHLLIAHDNLSLTNQKKISCTPSYEFYPCKVL